MRDEGQREKLRQLWLDPVALDPSRRSAKVTREIAAQLATIAKTLEAAGHDPELVAGFLTRCLFSMFAEDVGLLPVRAFSSLLESLKENPAQFVPLVGEMWKAMDAGHFSVALRTEVLHFNGKLFKQPQVLPLDRDQIELMLEAAKFDWKEVEPAIFGTLLERALDPEERHRLGAHYTPRAYVERLVLPTVIEPLRDDWKNAQAAALLLAAEGKLEEARKEVHAFHHKLCDVRVLDPACGSGNFLYVTLEHLKRLEGEVLNQLEAFGEGQARLDMSGVTVDPHQLLGIELNPRAAAISEVVLWIGYLQWHFRTRGNVMPPQPVLKDFRNIECRDAVLAYDRMTYVMDEHGKTVSRWNGKTFKKHPITGEDVPDDTARVPLERYVNPRKAEWPRADFVVGNPPFIGSSWMRTSLGDGYAEALRDTWTEVPESADFVLYWWNQAAALTRRGKLRRFGLITTNSLRQKFARRIIENYLLAKPPLSLVFTIPDHPWVDNADGAAVRIAMTVGAAGSQLGQLVTVTDEHDSEDDAVAVTLRSVIGIINPDLTIGVNVSAAVPLRSNEFLSNTGVKLHGAGFIVTREQAKVLGLGSRPGLENHIRRYRNGKDLTAVPREVMVIDLDGLSSEQVRQTFPEVFQWVLERVKPERDHNNEPYRRINWWLFGRRNTELRSALRGLSRYAVTVETAKHRTFQFLDAEFLPDNRLIAFAFEDGYLLGILSSSIHVIWALATGGTLEDRPVYNKTRCFETFAFPEIMEAQQSESRDLAEQIDAHRTRQQAQHSDLALTSMYNVLEKLKSGEALTAKEKVTHEQGLVSVLKQLHDELDLAVLDAYGWSDLAPLMQVVNGSAAPGANSTPATRDECKRALDDTLLERLVALNTDRAAEERKGTIRWLRPEFQNPDNAAGAKSPPAIQAELNITEEDDTVVATATIQRLPWPKELPDQVRQVADLLSSAREPMSLDTIAAHFTGKGPWKRRLPQIVETLETLGRARRVGDGVLGAN